MSRRKLVILGASGFVGTTLAERQRKHQQPDHELVSVINSAGSAWRLARHGEPLVQVDIADAAALRRVIEGATHVVNCTRGGRDVMIGGLANILKVCLEQKVERFVHLSSVLVYGDPPAPASAREDAPPDGSQSPDSYGGMKLEQDRMVLRAVADGLPSVVLCPPNISGPFSLYLCGLVDALRKGSFALLDDGAGPCNIVDVRSLCRAIEGALDAAPSAADGRRLFVADEGAPTWHDVVQALLPLTGLTQPRHVARADIAARVARDSQPPPVSVLGALKHLVASDVRSALRKDPLLARVDGFARSTVARLGVGIEDKLRRGIEGAVPVPRIDPLAGLQIGLCAQQLRDVRHENGRITAELGFQPPIDFKQSMEDFCSWYPRDVRSDAGRLGTGAHVVPHALIQPGQLLAAGIDPLALPPLKPSPRARRASTIACRPCTVRSLANANWSRMSNAYARSL